MSTARAFDVTNKPLEQGFEQLFDEHYPLIYRTAYSVTGSREDAEDIVQTIFLRLYRRGAWTSLNENPKAFTERPSMKPSA